MRSSIFALVCFFTLPGLTPAHAADRTVLLIAGTPSHGPGQHEHNAGVLLFQRCLGSVPGLKARIALDGWPRDAALLDGVDAVVIYSDGGGKHPALVGDHLALLGRMMDRGVGLGLLHYAIEPAPAKGEAEFLQWVGGCFSINWSVNPHWDAEFKTLPVHPATRGVRPFRAPDEWYYHLRFQEGMKGITPLLTAVPGESTLSRPDGPHEGNPAVRAAVARGEPQVVAWAFERANGGRGFGFSGGHFHRGWGNDDARKLVLNAIAWLAKAEVPATGVASTVTDEDLAQNLDPKPKKPATPPAPAGTR